MQDHVHRGARSPGLTSQPADPRIRELDASLRLAEVASDALPRTGMQRDSGRASIARQRAVGRQGQFVIGTVLHAFPFLDSYKVQLADGRGWVQCCAGSQGGLIPMGPRIASLYPPNSTVLVHMPPGLNFGYIICALPPIVFDGRVSCPDWLVQGCGAGLKRELAHKYPIKSLFATAGMHDFSSQRPLDATALEQAMVSMFGGAFSIDDVMAFLRLDEMCGIWLHWHDSAMRIAGKQLLVESGMHEDNAHVDEGECISHHGRALYPHEAIGLYDKDSILTKEFDDADVHYKIHRGKVDLPEEWEDTEPVYRWQEYGGYLGQGHYRGLMKPAKEDGKRRRRDAAQDLDEGLLRETIGADGSFTLLSAKRLYIGKRCKIVVPRELRLPEDGKGDDARADNYKFSSLYGSGEEHKIKDPKLDGDLQSLRRAAAVNDYAAYLADWQGIHPFHYHKADYHTPQETDMQRLEKIQEILPFAEDSTGECVIDATPTTIHIDHRYGDVDYFQRESFLVFHDDGTVQLGSGCGAHIVLGGGDIDLQAPHKVKVQAGTEWIVNAHQGVIRTKGSVSISSTEKNVDIKAEQMLMLLGGNDKKNGVLIESKGEGLDQDYKNKFGEDVVGPGIVFKAAKSAVVAIGGDIYVRSGPGGDLVDGDITLDAGRGARHVHIVADETNIFFGTAVSFATLPASEGQPVRTIFRFDEEEVVLDASVYFGGDLVGYAEESALRLRGDIELEGSVEAGGDVASASGGLMGKVPQVFRARLDASLAAVETEVAALKPPLASDYQGHIVATWYPSKRPGEPTTIQDIGFSFRDPPDGDQYKVEGLLWPEPRWQEMVRFGLGTGGVPWTEKPVEYQGNQLYPYPGKKKLTEDTINLQLKELTMFDPDKGYDRDRPGPYEDAKIADWERTVLDGVYLLIR